MTQNQASHTVEVARLPAAAAGTADAIRISVDIADGGAISAVIPVKELANGYSVVIEPGRASVGDSPAYDLQLTSGQYGILDLNLRIKAPSREVAVAVQRELSVRIEAILRPEPNESLHAGLVRNLFRFSRRKRLAVGGVAASGILAATLVFAMGHRSARVEQTDPTVPTDIAPTLASPGFPQPLAQLVPIAPTAGPEKDMDVTGNQLNDVDMGNLKTMGAKVGIQLRAGEVPFYVLADPACAACRALEPIWTQVPAHYKPIVIPVGFQTGGEALAIAIQCSKDRVAAWKKTLAGDESLAAKGSACKDGATKVNAGNLFFHYLRLTGTPTIIAPNGVIASGGDTAETLTAFLKQNEAAK